MSKGMEVTSLARQLKKLQTPQTSVLREQKGRLSFLYDYREASGIDNDTHYALALSGLQALTQIDPSFDSFRSTLFTETSKTFERGIQSREDNDKLDVEIDKFLFRVLSPYFLLTSTHKTLEWLIYKYRVNEYNVDNLICCLLPYHETRLFARLIQVCRQVKDPSNKWNWLQPVQDSGVPLAKSTLINHCSSDLGFLRLICESISLYISLNCRTGTLISFCTSTLIGVLNASAGENIIHVLVNYITTGLRSGNLSYVSSAYAVFSYLASKVVLDRKRVNKLMARMGKRFAGYYFRDQVANEFLLTSAVVCYQQNLTELPENVVLNLDPQSVALLFDNSDVSLFVSCVVATLTLGVDQEAHFNKLLSLLQVIKANQLVVRKCVEAVVELHSKEAGTLSKELKQKLTRVLEVIERRFPNDFDKALDECKYPAIDSLVASARFISVEGEDVNYFMGLRHPSPVIRLAALDYVFKTSKNVLKEENQRTKEVLRNALLLNMRDTNADILVNLLKCKQLLLNLVPQKKLISSANKLLSVVASKVEENREVGNIEEVDKWFSVKNAILGVMCDIKYTSQKEFINNVIPYMFPTCDEELGAITVILESKGLPPALYDLSEKCLAQIKADPQASSFVAFLCKQIAVDVTKSDHPIMDLLVDVKSTSFYRNMLEMVVVCNVFRYTKDYQLINQLVQHQVNTLHYLLKRYKLRKVKSEEYSLENLEPFLKIAAKDMIPLQLVTMLMANITEFMVYPDVKPGWFWHFQNNQTCYIYAVFRFLCENASSGSRFSKYFQPLLINFTKKVMNALGMAFFSAAWTWTSSPATQSRSMNVCIPFANKGTTFSQLDVLSLLIALRSPSGSVRSLASSLLPLVKNFPLLQFLAADVALFEESESQVSLSLAKWFKIFTGDVSKQKKSEKERVDWFQLILEHCTGDATPLSVKYGLFLLLSEVNDYAVVTSMSQIISTLAYCSELNPVQQRIAKVISEKVFSSLTLNCVVAGEDPIVDSLFMLIKSKGYKYHVLKLIKLKWFEGINSEEVKLVVLEKLLDFLAEERDHGVEKRVKKLLTDGEMMSRLIDKLTFQPFERLKSPAKKKRVQSMRRKSFSVDEWKQVILLLELFQSRTEFANSTFFMKTCFALLNESYINAEVASSEYFRKLLLSSISICLKQEDCDWNLFDIQCVLESFRHLRQRETQRESLSLVNFVSKHFKTEILQNIMVIFGYIGSNMVQCDDEYTLKVLDETLEAIIPTVLEGEEEEASEQVRDNIVDVFIDALIDIPTHRRLHLFKNLSRLLSEEKSLWYIVLKLLERSLRMKNAKKEHFQGFAVTIAVNNEAIVMLVALKQLLEVAVDFDDSQTIVKGRRFSLRDSEKRELVQTIATTILSILTTEELVTRIADCQWPDLSEHFESLMKALLVAIDKVSKNADRRRTLSYSKPLIRTLYHVLEKMSDMLPSKEMVDTICLLLKSDNLAVRRKAVELLNAKLSREDAVHLETDLLELLVEPLTALIRDVVSNSSDATVITGQLSLLSIKLLSKLLEKNESSVGHLRDVLLLVVSIAKDESKKVSVNFEASLLLCLAQLSVSLGSDAVPFIPSIIPVVIRQLTAEVDVVLLSSISALSKIARRFSLFLSPYLLEIIAKLCRVSRSRNTCSNSFESKLVGVRKGIAILVPFRTLVTSFEPCYEQLSPNPEALCYFFQLVTNAFSKAEKSDIEAVLPQLQKFILKALDYRNAHTSTENSQVEGVEKQFISTLVTLIPKLSEITFKPLFYKLYDWAIRAKEGTLSLRVITFYKVSEQLADTLKSLFCAFAAPFIVSNCVQQLDNYKNLENPEEAEKQLAHTILTGVLKTLAKCFLHDVNRIFASKERVQTLMQPILDQISNELGSKEMYEYRVSEGVGKCVEHLVRAISDSSDDISVARDLHYRLLLKTRENSPQVRFHTLRVLHQLVLSLNEEYLPLLPEAIPFLAELHEDDCEDIQKLLAVVFNDMEQLVGEPITSCF